MTAAICFKCGGNKTGAFATCGSCTATPRLNSELTVSLALCAHLSSDSQLLQYASEVRNHLRLTVPDEVLLQARNALNDPQLMSMIGSDPIPPPNRPQTPRSDSK